MKDGGRGKGKREKKRRRDSFRSVRPSRKFSSAYTSNLTASHFVTSTGYNVINDLGTGKNFEIQPDISM